MLPDKAAPTPGGFRESLPITHPQLPQISSIPRHIIHPNRGLDGRLLPKTPLNPFRQSSNPDSPSRQLRNDMPLEEDLSETSELLSIHGKASPALPIDESLLPEIPYVKNIFDEATSAKCQHSAPPSRSTDEFASLKAEFDTPWNPRKYITEPLTIGHMAERNHFTFPTFNDAIGQVAAQYPSKHELEKMTNIASYAGDAKAYRSFTTAMDLRFTRHRSIYTNAWDRISYVIEHLTGRARQ